MTIKPNIVDLESVVIILLIWMFPKRFQTNEVIEIVVELIYPMLFHLITPYMVLGMRK